MASRKTWTDEERADIERRMRDGATDADLGRQYGVSRKTIGKLRAQAGIDPQPRGDSGYERALSDPLPPALVAQIEERLAEGHSAARVVRDLGVPLSRVTPIRRAMGFRGARKLLDAQEVALVEDYRRGDTYVALAASYGISVPGVRLILRRRGVEKRGHRKRSLTAEERVEVRDLYAAGEDQADLAREYGVSQRAILDAAGEAPGGRRRGRPRGPGGRLFPLRPGQIQAIEEAFRAGTPASRISRDTGVPPKQVAQTLEDLGLRAIARKGTTPEEARAFVEAYQEGETTTAIGRRMGVSPGRVMAAIRAAGVAIRRGGRQRSTTAEQEEAMVVAAQEGLSVREIAARTGATPFQVRAAMARAGVTPGPTGPRSHRLIRLTEEQTLAMATDYESGLTLAEVGARHGVSPPIVKRALDAVGTPTRVPGKKKRKKNPKRRSTKRDRRKLLNKLLRL